jgi:hypothetical protein
MMVQAAFCLPAALAESEATELAVEYSGFV